jgi:hypothetical protein
MEIEAASSSLPLQKSELVLAFPSLTIILRHGLFTHAFTLHLGSVPAILPRVGSPSANSETTALALWAAGVVPTLPRLPRGFHAGGRIDSQGPQPGLPLTRGRGTKSQRMTGPPSGYGP